MFGDQFGVVGADSSIDLDVEGGVFFAEICNFFHHIGHEFLSSEAGLNGHDQDLVDEALGEEFLDFAINWGFGAECHSDSHVVFLDEFTHLG